MNWLLARIMNNPMVIVYVATLCFAAGLASGAIPAWKYQGALKDAVQAHYDSFVAQTKTIGEQAAKAAKKLDEEHAKEMKNAEQNTVYATNSIDAYYRAHPAVRVLHSDSGCSPDPKTTDHPKSTDGTPPGTDASAYLSEYNPQVVEQIASRLDQLQKLLMADGVAVQ